jgi:hypothetical protein
MVDNKATDAVDKVGCFQSRCSYRQYTSGTCHPAQFQSLAGLVDVWHHVETYSTSQKILSSWLVSFLLPFSVWPLLHNHSRCREFLLYLITLSDTHTHLVGLLWKRDRPVAETCTWQQTTLTRDRHPFIRRESNPQFHDYIFHLKLAIIK